MNVLMNTLKWTALSLILIGAINWGLIGAFDFDLVSRMFGEMSVLTRLVYMFVGLAAIVYLVFAIIDRHFEDEGCFN